MEQFHRCGRPKCPNAFATVRSMARAHVLLERVAEPLSEASAHEAQRLLEDLQGDSEADLGAEEQLRPRFQLELGLVFGCVGAES